MCMALPTPPSDPGTAPKRPPGPVALFFGGIALLIIFAVRGLIRR